MRYLMILGLVFWPSLGFGAIYKCEVDGAIMYQGAPCRGADSEKLSIESDSRRRPGTGLRPGERELLREIKNREDARLKRRRSNAKMDANRRKSEQRAAEMNKQRCQEYESKARLYRWRVNETGRYATREYNKQQWDRYRQKAREYCKSDLAR